jgi:hypothetical protein
MMDRVIQIIAHPSPPRHKYSALLVLLAYATTHHHSRFWISPLTRLLESEVGDV